MHDELLPRVSRGELSASLKFIALVLLLLLLPNRELDVLFGVNPRRVWLVVVFIAGLSFLGYLLAKVVGPRAAISLSGVLGGAVSPGMTIMSLLEQYRGYSEFNLEYTFAAAIAATMLFSRNFIVVGIVAPALALSLVIPFVAMAGVGLTVTGLLWSRVRTRDPPASELDTPFRVRPALAIGATIAIILAIINTFELALPSYGTRIGVVIATVFQLMIYTGIAWTSGARKMAQVIGVILLGSASVGIALVLFT